MKKKFVKVIFIGMLFGIVGCEGKKEVDIQTETETVSSAIENEETKGVDSAEEKRKSEVEALGGVYLNGGSLEKVKMGTYYEGGIKGTCMVKMPAEYMFGAVYTDDSGQENSVPEIGNSSVQEVLDKGILEELGYPCSFVLLHSYEEDSSSMSLRIFSSDIKNMQNIKERNNGGTDFGTAEHPAYYYVDSDEHAYTDLSVAYQINSNILLLMEYSGPLAGELGLEQLAQNMYDLVEISE